MAYFFDLDWSNITTAATTIAKFPDGPNTHHFESAADSKNSIRKDFKGLRGIYLWTNNINGKQYVGSSKNLSGRLSNYYNNNNNTKQDKRGSLISKDILNHGISVFSLTIHVLGPTPAKGSDFGPHNQPDHIKLEDYYLNTYTLIYNVKRYASGPYYSAKSSINEESSNSSG